jgi:hypothetical protein
VNPGNWEPWVGRSQVAEDVVTSRLIKSFRATLTPPLAEVSSEAGRFAKAAASGADAVILDLKDAVAPSSKEEARRAWRNTRGPSVVP